MYRTSRRCRAIEARQERAAARPRHRHRLRVRLEVHRPAEPRAGQIEVVAARRRAHGAQLRMDRGAVVALVVVLDGQLPVRGRDVLVRRRRRRARRSRTARRARSRPPIHSRERWPRRPIRSPSPSRATPRRAPARARTRRGRSRAARRSAVSRATSRRARRSSRGTGSGSPPRFADAPHGSSS